MNRGFGVPCESLWFEVARFNGQLSPFALAFSFGPEHNRRLYTP